MKKEKENINITFHAYKRAKERMKWKKSVVAKMALLAYSNGISHYKTKGDLKKYINSLWRYKRTANNIKIYGEDVYLFHNNTLLTLYRVPRNLVKHIKYITND